MDYITRLSELFDKYCFYYFIKYLSQNSVIAGGSVVYALNEYVPKSSVSDIDIFINNKQELIHSLEMLKLICPNCKFSCFWNYQSSESYIKINGMSIISATIDGENIYFQFILLEYDNPNDVIESFDLDYVQCGIHNGKIYITEMCKKSHEDRCVNYCTELPLQIHRLKKAHLKGFYTPLFGNSEYVSDSYSIGNEIPSPEQLHYFEKRDKHRATYSLKDGLIIGMNITKSKKYGVEYGKFDIQFGDFIQSSEYITIKINVLACYENHVAIDYISFGDHIINRCRNKTGKEIDRGIHYALISSHYVNHNNNNHNKKLYFSIHEILEKEVVEMRISDKFKIFNVRITEEIDDLIRKHHQTSDVNSLSLRGLLSLIDKHGIIANQGETRLNRVSFIKHKAYGAFLHCYKTEHKSISIAVKHASTQMVYDFYKMNEDPICAFTLSLYNNNHNHINTIGQMIDFIEGFN